MGKGKGKSRGKWESEETKASDINNYGTFKTWFDKWIVDFESWGQNVRDDIVRLEGHAGFPTGDPGDPPGGPF